MTKGSASPTALESYNPVYFSYLFAIEDRHFWFRARNEVIPTLVHQLVPGLAPGYCVLEVGCGTGNVLRILEKTCVNGKVIGMDLFAEGLRYARQRTSCPLVQGDMHRPAFGRRFDLIGLFDVLEHLPNDLLVLHDLNNLLQDGGALLLTVPAHPSLWSYFDEASRHVRRYKPDELESKLLISGYRIEYLTQYLASIFPLVWLGRRLASLTDRRPRDDQDRTHSLASAELRVVPVFNNVLAFMLIQEIRFIALRRRLPIGTSLLALARKETGSTA